MKKITKLKLLTVCIFLAQHSHALEQLNDSSLGAVTGQDGISIAYETSKITIDQANWIDYSNTGSMKLGLHNVEVKGLNQSTIKSTLDFDVGKTDQSAGVKIQASISPFEATIEKLMLLCTSADCTTPSQNLGALSLSTLSPLNVFLQTSAGLFNRDEKAHLDFQLQNASLGYGLNGKFLTLKDFNFNFSLDGYLYLDSSEGVVLSTKSKDGQTDHLINLHKVSDLTDVDPSRSGAKNPAINIDLRYGANAGNQKNLIRMGASGAVTNGKVFLNANQNGLAEFNSVSRTAPDLIETTKTATGYEFAGAGGLHMGLSADFTRAGNSLLTATDTPTTLEIGHTGHGSYALEFSNLSPLTIRNSTSVSDLNTRNAYIDFGDIYINTAQIKSLGFIINDNIKKVLGAGNNYLSYNLTPENSGQNVALIAIRGLDFQAIARKTRFIADNSIAEITSPSGEWGIGIPVFNLNANIALFAKNYTYNNTIKSGLGYNAAFSTEGYGIDKKTNAPSTTSIIVVDGAQGSHGEEVNYYAGLRNIDAYLKSDGVIGFEDDGIYIKADHLLFAAKAEVAIGQLPGSLYNCPTGVNSCTQKVVPIDNFARKDDVLSSIAFKLDGKGELFIIPGVNSSTATPESNFLSLKANFEFTDLTDAEKKNQAVLGSYISVTTEDLKENGSTTSSSVNLNKLQGQVALESRVSVKKDTVVLDNKVNFNHASTFLTKAQIDAGNIGRVFRAEMAMSPSGNMQKVADFAITGGAMRSTLGITPR